MASDMTVRSSNFDRFLQIHQSYSLEKIVRQNDLSLKLQLSQNKELRSLNNQISSANDLTRKILKNQITEIEQRENQKFYKKLSFSTSELISSIEKIENPVLKYYFLNIYCKTIIENINDSIENLSEINDKIFNKQLKDRIENILVENRNNENTFKNSPFYQLDALTVDYNNKVDNLISTEVIPDKVPKLWFKSKIRGLRWFLIGILFLFALISFSIIFNTNLDFGGIVVYAFLFWMPLTFLLYREIKWIKNYPFYYEHQKLKNLEIDKQVKNENTKNKSKYNNMMLEIENHELHKVMAEIETDYPEVQQLMEKLSIIVGVKNDKEWD